MKHELKALRERALADISSAEPANLKDLEVSLLGKKGELTSLLKGLGSLSIEEKKDIGKFANTVRDEIKLAFEDRSSDILAAEMAALAKNEWIDVTHQPLTNKQGTVHPFSQIMQELEGIFTSMGFEIFDGDHIETEEFNFDALNIPPDHPARDHQDTFWLQDGRVLRSQTSDTWARILRTRDFPLRGVSLGRVFRNEALDASHEHTFHQFEGFYIDKDVSVANMTSALQTMLSRIFGTDITVRLRPGYFPFVEPGYELDFQCTVCNGKGCSVCKHVGWIELLGCGMIHPNVLRMAGKDPDQWRGFAWGGGLERLLMMRHKISDIRMFHECDIRDLRQF